MIVKVIATGAKTCGRLITYISKSVTIGRVREFAITNSWAVTPDDFIADVETTQRRNSRATVKNFHMAVSFPPDERPNQATLYEICLLYTSDAADE